MAKEISSAKVNCLDFVVGMSAMHTSFETPCDPGRVVLAITNSYYNIDYRMEFTNRKRAYNFLTSLFSRQCQKLQKVQQTLQIVSSFFWL